ncbi:hypothetical protein BDR26DRAFT_905085 [Obelidium mucronatum]|nr:hypothetical protein BDR26DRAFT_905085 [Obelidium mucronatum]
MKGDKTKTESKRVILNDSNYVAWRRLTLVVIGAKNQRTLAPSFKPYVNKYERPNVPSGWSKLLTLKPTESDNDVDNGSDEEDEDETDGDGENETEDKGNQPEDTTKASMAVFRVLEELWQIEEKREITDVEAMRATMKAIHEGMSKNMQIAYSNLETPSTLWEEFRRTKDPANRKLDTSAADTYRGFGIKENQSIPDFLRAVREIEVRCTALGETLHLGMAAQKTIRLKLDHRFAQAVMMLSTKEYETVESMETDMKSTSKSVSWSKTTE